MGSPLGLGRVLAATVLLACTTHGFAQSEFAIEEIIVTAQKRSESLQDVPIAISAFDERALEVAKVKKSESGMIADPVTVLNFLIGGGLPPAAPFPNCGDVAGADPDSCVVHAACP